MIHLIRLYAASLNLLPAKNLEQVSQDDNQVPIITVHQSKGMEFDSIFITGATEDEFPSFFSVRDSNLRRKDDCFMSQ